MCECTPNKRTPWCGKPGCEMPVQVTDKNGGDPQPVVGDDELRKQVVGHLSILQVRAVRASGGTTLTSSEEREVEERTDAIMALIHQDREVREAAIFEAIENTTAYKLGSVMYIGYKELYQRLDVAGITPPDSEVKA